jgi:hypothetical protein
MWLLLDVLRFCSPLLGGSKTLLVLLQLLGGLQDLKSKKLILCANV